MKYDLSCRYDSRQCFYGKAQVEDVYQDGSLFILYSYNTPVAQVDHIDNKIIYDYYGKYSQTTTRHQKEFFKQFGLSDKEIKQLFKDGKLIINNEEVK